MSQPRPHAALVSLAPLAAVTAAMLSITLGATVAKGLFGAIGPAGTTAVRLTLAAAILAVAFRVWRAPVTPQTLLAAAPYGLCLGAMNLLFYLAIDRIPLGVALALEFTGPLAVATFASRRWMDLIWVSLAVLGLALLLPAAHAGEALDPLGVALALGAGVFWGAYIFTGQRAGAALGSKAPALGMIFAALLALPFGIAEAGAALLDLRVLALGLVVAVLSSALPYTLEMFALRRLPARTYGVLTSGEPAIGAVVAAILLAESLSLLKWLGIAAVVAASLGVTWTGRKPIEPQAATP